MWSVVTETVRILNESAIYLLLGFALAGVLHWLLSRSAKFSDLLSTRGSKSVFLAAFLGLPLPLCSCSVLPAGLALRKKGASKGATASFLISVPETDIVSILLTYGLLGPVMAIFRPFAALVTAIVTGLAINLTERWSADSADAGAPAEADPACACEEDDYRRDRSAPWNVLHYGFVKFFDDIIGSLLFGLVLGGIITALLPSMGLERLAGGSFISMLAMLVVGIPMYVCATSSTPIAAGLIVAGVSPGAALVFLLVGPATNTASLVVLSKYFGRTALAVYLCSIALISVLMGLWLDAFVGSGTVSLSPVLAPAAAAGFTLWKIAGAVILLVLTGMSFRRTHMFETLVRGAARVTGLPLSTGMVKIGFAVCAVAVYAGSGFFIVAPGERAVETRFGRIVRSNLQPGLHYRWPYPVGAQDIEPVAQVKRIELGFRLSTGGPTVPAADPAQRILTTESWMLTGNEDIIDIKWAVQYQVVDSEAGLLDYLYGVADPAQLVRSVAEASIRAAVGCRNIDTLLTTERGAVEEMVKTQVLQPALDRCQAGIRVLGVDLLDVHAPPDVHWAFRDVASAAEDKMKSINIAYEYFERVVREARGDAARRVLQAAGRAVDTVQRARGESSAFVDQWEAYRLDCAITRRRIYFEAIDAVLMKLRKYIPPAGTAEGLDLWLIAGEPPAELPFVPRREVEARP